MFVVPATQEDHLSPKIQGQPGQHSETLCQNKQKKKENSYSSIEYLIFRNQQWRDKSPNENQRYQDEVTWFTGLSRIRRDRVCFITSGQSKSQPSLLKSFRKVIN
jgi:hypothetical protein